MPGPRKAVSKAVETNVLLASGRRCCLCVYFDQRHERKRGQIAHLNHDRTDSRFENLVYLCLEHHDEFDSQTRLSKALTVEEVRAYRDRLYRSNPEFRPPLFAPEQASLDQSETAFAQVRRRFPDSLDYLSKPWRYSFWLTANIPELFAFKAANRADGICLIEQINLPDGRTVIACIQIPGTPGNSVTNAVRNYVFRSAKGSRFPAQI